jgi:hypothetical protein
MGGVWGNVGVRAQMATLPHLADVMVRPSCDAGCGFDPRGFDAESPETTRGMSTVGSPKFAWSWPDAGRGLRWCRRQSPSGIVSTPPDRSSATIARHCRAPPVAPTTDMRQCPRGGAMLGRRARSRPGFAVPGNLSEGLVPYECVAGLPIDIEPPGVSGR